MALNNVTETLVRFVFDDAFKRTGKVACTCEQCVDDILAFALNRLNPRYVSSNLGEAYVKTQYLNAQLQSDIVSELARAVELVRQRPRHPLDVAGVSGEAQADVAGVSSEAHADAAGVSGGAQADPDLR